MASSTTDTVRLLPLLQAVNYTARMFITEWVPYQAKFGTNTEVQFDVYGPRHTWIYHAFWHACKRVIQLKPDSFRYCWADSPCLKRSRNRLACSCINVKARLVNPYHSLSTFVIVWATHAHQQRSLRRWRRRTCWNCGVEIVLRSSSSLRGRLLPCGRCGSRRCCTSAFARIGIIASGVMAVARSMGSFTATSLPAPVAEKTI